MLGFEPLWVLPSHRRALKALALRAFLVPSGSSFHTATTLTPGDGLRILFVCSRNQWRSPTAERVYAKRDGLEVRSAGTSASAKRRVRAQDIEWADLTFVMEQEHKNRLRKLFGRMTDGERVFVLDIPDDYQAMDPELIDLISTAIDPILTFHQTRGNAP